MKRRKRSPVARLRPFWIPLMLLAALVAGVLLFGGMWQGFEPKRIIVTGNTRVSRGEILTHAAIRRNVSMWVQNTGAMANRVSTIPYVESVRVARLPPATIRIAVTERQPFAVIRSGDVDMLVDRRLRVLEQAPQDAPALVFLLKPGLDVAPGEFVKAQQAVKMRDVCEAMTARHIVPVQIAFDRFGGLVVTLRSGLRLLLGSSADLDQKLTLANAIMAQVLGRQRVAALDLRAPSAPVLVYR